ncbi:PIN domain-containing protein [Pseudonocardia phyllosphaerae]|uniref:PIN domain-containing protein n=1 Tax=Pseudonocardia phyllosphaerae TaxID=3390502 RepID=UPI00397E0EE4
MADTSVLIDRPTGGFAAWADVVLVTIVSVAELEYGAQTSDPVQALARRRRLRAVVDTFDVLSLDVAGAELYGALAELVRRRGRNPRPRRFDLLIAAIAARHGLPLLTRDRDGLAGLERLVHVETVT